MSDLFKGIIIGIIAVKVFESDTVQNYIQKKVEKKCRDAGEALGRALYPPKKKEEKPEYVKATLSNGDSIYILKASIESVGPV